MILKLIISWSPKRGRTKPYYHPVEWLVRNSGFPHRAFPGRWSSFQKSSLRIRWSVSSPSHFLRLWFAWNLKYHRLYPKLGCLFRFDEGTQWLSIAGEIKVDFVSGGNSASVIHTLNDSFACKIFAVHATIAGMLGNMVGTGEDAELCPTPNEQSGRCHWHISQSP